MRCLFSILCQTRNIPAAAVNADCLHFPVCFCFIVWCVNLNDKFRFTLGSHLKQICNLNFCCLIIIFIFLLFPCCLLAGTKRKFKRKHKCTKPEKEISLNLWINWKHLKITKEMIWLNKNCNKATNEKRLYSPGR